MKPHHFVIAAVFSLALSFMAGPFNPAQAGKLVADDKDKTYYVWCLYEKKLVHKNPYKRKKAEKKAKKHRDKMGHGTKLLTEKPEEF